MLPVPPGERGITALCDLQSAQQEIWYPPAEHCSHDVSHIQPPTKLSRAPALLGYF